MRQWEQIRYGWHPAYHPYTRIEGELKVLEQ
jgi:hypothetical protein